jgi:hypothetical protein
MSVLNVESAEYTVAVGHNIAGTTNKIALPLFLQG